MTELSDDATDDAHLWREEIRSLVSGANLVVLIAVIALGVWGVFDSMTDADGDRVWGTLVVVAPGIYAGWCMLEASWRSGDMTSLLLRLVSACLIAPLLALIPIAVVQAIAVAFPGVRDTIAQAAAQNTGFHYFWDEGVVSQLYLVPIAGYAIGACIGLGVALIITLPVLSIRSPGVVSAGSHIEKVDGARRSSTTAFVFVGLGITVLGIALWAFGEGGSILEFPEDFGRLMNTLSHGYFHWDQAMWLIGAVLVVTGVLSMGWGCVRVLTARVRENGFAA
ncbi:hypothetical protein [Microbacterium sp. A93]|uniref:hypothetical protein n=1 Tax=Microbacterium sp. A93 TaxID=3450716 RepID=UPI003F43226D